MPLEERKQAIDEYQSLAKKNRLPSAEEVEKELGVWVDKPSALPFFIKAIYDRISSCAGHLEIIMHPARMADMIESRFYTEEQKKEIFTVYKDFLVQLHEGMLSVYTSQEEDIKYFRNLWGYYLKKVKPFMQDFLKNQINCWKKESEEEKTEQNYVR